MFYFKRVYEHKVAMQKSTGLKNFKAFKKYETTTLIANFVKIVIN